MSAPDTKSAAINYHRLGLHPLPVKPGEKYPVLDSWKPYQTRQPTLDEIDQWDWSGGCGITTNGFIVVDCDKGAEELLKGKDFPPSWTVRTGSGGLHRYFRSNGQRSRNKTRILKGENGSGVDIRADGGFVVMPPSRHKDTGRPYEWILGPNVVPLAPAPSWILEAVAEPKRSQSDSTPRQGAPREQGDVITRACAYLAKVPGAIEGQGGDNHTLSTACKIVRGFDLDEQMAIDLLLEWNQTCEPPWSEREIQQKVANALKYGTEPIGHLRDAERPPRTGFSPPTDDVDDGGYLHQEREEIQMEQESPLDETASLPAEAPAEELPTFPHTAFRGVAGEIAHTFAESLEAPPAFLLMDTLTFLGTMICTFVRLESQLQEEPRLYTVKLGESSFARKSSSHDTIEYLLTPLMEDRVTICLQAGSAEGLAKRMQPGLPTLLLIDELKAFVDKSSVQSSVLLPMVSSLFSRTKYENATKQSEIRLPDAHLSLTGACTIETFETMFSPQFFNIGFLNRLFLVAGKRTTLKPLPQSIPIPTLNALRGRVIAQVEKAEKERKALRFTEAAQARWAEFYCAMPETPYAARLDSYGLRLLMLYAVTTETWEITRDLVDVVIDLLDYELAIRRELDPIDAEGKVAAMEQRILRALSKGRMFKARLQDRAHVRTYGTWVYETAIQNVMRQHWVATQRVGKGQVFWLTEQGRERR